MIPHGHFIMLPTAKKTMGVQYGGVSFVVILFVDNINITH